MEKVKVKIITIGTLPALFQSDKLKDWKSDVFEIQGVIENIALRDDSDLPNWEFSDELILSNFPKDLNCDITLAIVNFPIEDNWYSRRLGNNKVVFTFYDTKDILEHCSIPLENAVYRMLYAYSLMYKRTGGKIPPIASQLKFTHDETRGCIFDMNGIKMDLSASCSTTILCDECEETLKREKISAQIINSVKKEIKKIKRTLYYRIFYLVKHHPIKSLALSSLYAVLLGVTGSITASYIYDAVK